MDKFITDLSGTDKEFKDILGSLSSSIENQDANSNIIRDIKKLSSKYDSSLRSINQVIYYTDLKPIVQYFDTMITAISNTIYAVKQSRDKSYSDNVQEWYDKILRELTELLAKVKEGSSFAIVKLNNTITNRLYETLVISSLTTITFAFIETYYK